MIVRDAARVAPAAALRTTSAVAGPGVSESNTATGTNVQITAAWE